MERRKTELVRSRVKGSNSLPDRHFTSPRGYILVLVAIMLSALGIMVALAIDANLLFSAREQGQHYLRMAALAGIEEYFATRCPNDNQQCHTTKLQAAIQRVNEVSRNNRLVLSRDAKIQVSESYDDDVETKLETGRWIVTETSARECGGTPAPCFQASQNFVNAIRLSVAYPMGVQPIFAKAFLGTESLKFRAAATAAVAPRRGCFLVDISPSTVRSTHLRDKITAPAANPPVPSSEFAYFLSSDAYPVAEGGNENIDGPNYQDSVWAKLADASNPHADRQAATWLMNTDPFYKFRHFRSDYQLMTTLGDADYDWNENSPHRRYHPMPGYAIDTQTLEEVSTPGAYSADSYTAWVDTYRDSMMTGPEPMTSIFQGIRSALDEFKSRSVTGDQVCLIFYDHLMLWPRIVKPNSDFSYMNSLLDLQLGTTPLGNSNTSVQGTGFMTAIQHSLMPGASPFTNTQRAIGEAINWFSWARKKTGVDASNFIVVISDGLTNCVNTADSAATSSACVAGKLQPSGGSNACLESYVYYRASMDALKTFVKTLVRAAGIPIHFILLGDNVAPHTVDVADPKNPGKCYTQEQIRGSSDYQLYVRGGDGTANQTAPGCNWWYDRYARKSSTVPFYEANRDAWEIAYTSGGIFAPIRSSGPGCVPQAAGSCNPGELRTSDPQCRAPGDQISGYMKTILGQNPYVVVQVE